jgi:hypothetical protein
VTAAASALTRIPREVNAARETVKTLTKQKEDSGAEHLRDLAIGAGPEATGMLASSHRRLLAHLRAGNGEATAAEIEGS